MLKEQIQSIVESVLSDLSLTPAAGVHLETPRDKSHGDFSTNVALTLAKSVGRPPRQLAQEIVARLEARQDLDAEVSLAGPGFINFRLNAGSAATALRALLAQGRNVGRSNAAAGLRVQLEYVSANPTGPLNVVSARAAAYGSTLAAIMQACGYDAASEFYVNDVGRQVQLFGASVRARLAEARGEDVAFPEEGYHGDYVRDIAAAVPEADAAAWNALPESEASKAFGAFGVERMLATQRRDLERFGVHYERWFRESELHRSGAIDATLQTLTDKALTYEKDGAQFFRSTTWNDDKDRVVVRSDGTPTYFLADAAYHRDKYEREFRHVINVWGPDHHGHIVRMQALARALGYPKDWLEVVIVQWVKLVEDGKTVRMSKRAGQLVTLADLLDEVGSDVAKYFFLMRQQHSHLDFDLDLARKHSDENPVFYVKYAHARICSVIRKAAETGWELDAAALQAAAVERLESPEEHVLSQMLLGYSNFLWRAAEAREPHRLTGYCEDLARSFHKFYHERRIIQDDRELGFARLALCHATRSVLASALGLMAIEAPQSM